MDCFLLKVLHRTMDAKEPLFLCVCVYIANYLFMWWHGTWLADDTVPNPSLVSLTLGSFGAFVQEPGMFSLIVWFV